MKLFFLSLYNILLKTIFGTSSTDFSQTSAEFESVISFNNKIIPIDVKKDKGTLNSLAKYKST